jgi:carbamoyl-phosphate synthase large subunit
MNARVPVTASGSIVTQDIIKSLKLASKTGRVKYNIIAADMSPLAAGLYRCDAGVLVPPASSPDYVDAIVKICEKMSAQPVFCGSDDELLALASKKERIEKNWRQAADRLFRSVGCRRGQVGIYESCKANNLSCAPSALPEEREEFAREFSYPL